MNDFYCLEFVEFLVEVIHICLVGEDIFRVRLPSREGSFYLFNDEMNWFAMVYGGMNWLQINMLNKFMY